MIRVALILVLVMVGLVGYGAATVSEATGYQLTEQCETQSRPVKVTFSKSQHPNIIAHIKASWRKGYPKILRINREGADERRDALLSKTKANGQLKWPTKDGYDRDEAPAAVLRSKVKASVRYVPLSENRSAGAILGNSISGYCEGQQVAYRFAS